MKNAVFEGAGVALITPMNADGSINYDEFGRMIDFQIENGTDCLLICGTTGEASTMSDEEHIECIRFAAERSAGRVPVMAGTGSNDTAYAIELSRKAEEAGADCLLVVTPYYNKTSQRGLVAHFTAIADSVKIPVFLYNIPSRTGVNIAIDTFRTLSEHPNIYGVKEAGGNIDYFAQIIAAVGEDFAVYSGDDGMTIPVMSIGGKGVISVLSNIMPKEMHELCKLCLDNNYAEAGKLQIKYLPLIKALFSDVNPIPVKEACNLAGFKAGPCRMPLYPMTDECRAKLADEMKKMGLNVRM